MSERLQRRLMLAPFVVGATVLVVAPALATFGLALFHYDGLSAPRWAGLDNFDALLDDPFLADAVRASLLFIVLAVPLRLAVACGLALLHHRRLRRAAVHRTAAFLPTAVPDVAWALVWAWILNPIYGPVNALLGSLGVPRPDWFAGRSGAMAGFVVMSAFTVGEAYLVAAAARAELGDELHDSARLAGASPWRALRKLTLPLMAPTLALLAVRDVAVSLQSTFAAVYLITDGGPDRATLFLPVLVYDYAFEQLRYGYAAAVTLILFALTMAAIAILWRLLRRRQFGALT